MNDTSSKEQQEPGRDPLAEAKAEAEKFKNDYLYLRAEFDNYKKHVIRERAESQKYGSERLFVELLTVLDNFERALETKITPETVQNFSKGVEMTAQEFRAVLQRFGVSEISCLGQPFDPNFHEALSSEVSREISPGHILRVFRKPYKLHDRMIRPAQVVVAKKPEQA